MQVALYSLWAERSKLSEAAVAPALDANLAGSSYNASGNLDQAAYAQAPPRSTAHEQPQESVTTTCVKFVCCALCCMDVDRCCCLLGKNGRSNLSSHQRMFPHGVEMGALSGPPPSQPPIHPAAWNTGPAPAYGSPPAGVAQGWGAPPPSYASQPSTGVPPSFTAWGASPSYYGEPPTTLLTSPTAWGAPPAYSAPATTNAWGAPPPQQANYAAVPAPYTSPAPQQTSYAAAPSPYGGVPMAQTAAQPQNELVAVVIPFGTPPGSMVQCTTPSGQVVSECS